MRSVAASPIVPIWAQTAPGARPASMPWSTATSRTASPSVTIVMATSAEPTASAGLAAATAPSSVRADTAEGVRFHTTVVKPARSRLVAKAEPIVPVPSTATVGSGGVVVRGHVFQLPMEMPMRRPRP